MTHNRDSIPNTYQLICISFYPPSNFDIKHIVYPYQRMIPCMFCMCVCVCGSCSDASFHSAPSYTNVLFVLLFLLPFLSCVIFFCMSSFYSLSFITEKGCLLFGTAISFCYHIHGFERTIQCINHSRTYNNRHTFTVSLTYFYISESQGERERVVVDVYDIFRV